MAVPQSAKRISALPPMGGEEINKIQANETVDGQQYTYADKWAIGVDSLLRDGGTDPWFPGDDQGSVFIPMSRIAMRDSNGLIPANMLPSYVDDMMFGTLAVDTTEGKATFSETPPSGSSTVHTYVSPESKKSPGELDPPANVIFCDTSTSLQYRYIKANENTSSDWTKYGFTEIPGSRTITTTYGLNITPDQQTSGLTIDVAKPKYFVERNIRDYALNDSEDTAILHDSSTIEGSSTGHILDFVFNEGGEEEEIDGETYSRSYNFISFSHESGEVSRGQRFYVTLDIDANPITLSPNLIDVTIKFTANRKEITQSRKMDMSIPVESGKYTTHLHYAFVLGLGDTQSSSIAEVCINAEEPINMKLQRFSMVELI